jgi:ABC-2 type transport system ATP-binding protein
MIISTSSHGAQLSAGRAFLPAPRQSMLQTNSLTISLTDLLTCMLTDWMISLTICAKSSRARGNLRRTIDLRREVSSAAMSARQKSQHARKYPGWRLRRQELSVEAWPARPRPAPHVTCARARKSPRLQACRGDHSMDYAHEFVSSRLRTMIQVEHLRKNYGQVMAVDDISFQIDKGEIVGFLGLNGAGKTTTLRILTSYLPATSGIARVAGFDVMTQSMEVRRHIGFLPESVPLYSEMRVEEYLTYRAKLKEVDRTLRPQRIEEAMERCRVQQVRRRLIGTLSKGYRQRVGLADTLIHDPPILILDEPTAGLDPLQINETLDSIHDLAEQHTIILSNHILAEVEKICDRIIVIHKGRIGMDSKLSELAKDEQTFVLAEIRGPNEAITAALKAIDGVQSVNSKSASDGWFGFEVRTRQKRDVRESVFQAVAKGGWALRRLETRKRGIDDYFMSLVRSADGEAAEPPAVRAG